MVRESILPSHPTDFWIKRWFFGVGISCMLNVIGVASLVFQHSYAIGSAGRSHSTLVEVFGFQAILMGVAYLGLGLSLFSYAFAPYSDRLSAFSEYGIAVGLPIAAVGMMWCSWIFLTG
jgi:hypothetical protein